MNEIQHYEYKIWRMKNEEWKLERWLKSGEMTKSNHCVIVLQVFFFSIRQTIKFRLWIFPVVVIARIAHTQPAQLKLREEIWSEISLLAYIKSHFVLSDAKMISIKMYACGNGSSIIGIHFFSLLVACAYSFLLTHNIHKLEIENGEIHREKDREAEREPKANGSG